MINAQESDPGLGSGLLIDASSVPDDISYFEYKLSVEGSHRMIS